MVMQLHCYVNGKARVPAAILPTNIYPTRLISESMKTSALLEVPEEILLGTHLTAERLAERAKLEAAFALYREGSISSGLAPTWVNLPRVRFLTLAAAAGIAKLSDSDDDFERERGLLRAQASQHRAITQRARTLIFSNTTPFIALSAIDRLHPLPQCPAPIPYPIVSRSSGQQLHMYVPSECRSYVDQRI